MKVPNADLVSDGSPPEQTLQAFQLITSSIYECWPLGNPADFKVRTAGYPVGDLVFCELDVSPMRFHRTEKHLADPGTDFLVLEMQIAGEQALAMPDCNMRMEAGHIYLRDWALPFDTWTSEMSLTSILIPRHLVEAFDGLDPVISWPVDSPSGRVLSNLWSQLLGELHDIEWEEAMALCDGFLAFLGSVVPIAHRESEAELSIAMEHYLNARLQSDIAIEDLCEEFDVSRSTVFRLFQPIGGVRQYVVAARLDRCHADLWMADPGDVRIRDVAYSWGFSEPSSFSRSFRARFGLPASAIVGRGRQQQLNEPRTRQFSEWIREASGFESDA